jgi:long-chain acyl-CoA synthetase
VAVQMPNCLSYPGGRLRRLQGRLRAGQHQPSVHGVGDDRTSSRDSGARVLVIIDMFADRLPEVLPKTRIEKVVTVRIS